MRVKVSCMRFSDMLVCVVRMHRDISVSGTCAIPYSPYTSAGVNKAQYRKCAGTSAPGDL